MKIRTSLQNNLISIVALTFVIQAMVTADASAQMEKRKDEHYHIQLFEKSHPAIGEAAPELELVTLAGDKVKLSDYLGKQVVLIKG